MIVVDKKIKTINFVFLLQNYLDLLTVRYMNTFYVLKI